MEIIDQLSTILFVSSIFSLAVSWLSFSYICIPRIDKLIEKSSRSKVCPINVWGLRTFDMAIGATLPIGDSLIIKGHPMLSIEDIRSYTTRFDRIVGSCLLVSVVTLLLTVFIGSVWGAEK